MGQLFASRRTACARGRRMRWMCRRPSRRSRSLSGSLWRFSYEDSDLIVLDKPAGLVVHPAPGNESGTLVNALIAHAGEELAIGGEQRPGIVHRLDKDTSGVMVVAKTQAAMNALAPAFAARDLERVYLALAWGLPAPAAGEIEGAIGRDPKDRKRMAISARWAPWGEAGAHPISAGRKLACSRQPARVPAGHRADASDPGASECARASDRGRSDLPAAHSFGLAQRARAGAGAAAGLSTASPARGGAGVSASSNGGDASVRNADAGRYGGVDRITPD